MDPSSYSQERQKKGLLEHKEASILTDTIPGNCYKKLAREVPKQAVRSTRLLQRRHRKLSSQECVGANQAEERQDIPD